MADKKDKKDKKSGGGKGKGGDAAASPMQFWVTRAKGAGALLGFAIAFYVTRGQGFAMSDAIIRGLGGAIAMSLIAWWSSLMVITALLRSAAAQAHREAQIAVAEAAAAQQAADASYGRRPGAGDDLA
jgi:hypothetical protein